MLDFLNPVKGFGVTFRQMFRKVDTEQYPEENSRPRRATTAGTCSTGTRTGWRSASAASCARGPARPTRSTSRARDNTDDERYSPGERYGARLPDQLPALHLLRAVHRGLPDPGADDEQRVRAAPTTAGRPDLTKEQLMAPLLPGMEAPPHPMRLGDDEKDYYRQVAVAAAAGDR